MAAKIEVLSHQEALAAQAEDIKTYQSMLLNISSKLNQIGFKTTSKVLDGGSDIERHAIFKEDKKLNVGPIPALNKDPDPIVIIQPSHLGETRTLTTIHIDVYDEKAYKNCIKSIAENHRDSYNHLEKITIETYF